MAANEPQKLINVAALQAVKSGDTITLLETLGILWKKKWVLGLFVLVGAMLGGLVAN